MTNHTTVSNASLDVLLTNLAKEHLDIETLKIRNMDSLDFYDVSVRSVRSALKAAYMAGVDAACPGPHSKP